MKFIPDFLRRNRTCIVGTPYALLIYLLYSSYEDIFHTKFFVSDAISFDIYSNLSDVTFIDHSWSWQHQKELRLRSFFKSGLYRFFSKIYAQDHFGFSPALIGFCKYTLIEDGSGWYTYFKSGDSFRLYSAKSLRNRIIEILLYGPLYGRSVGRTFLCEDRLVTNVDDTKSDVLQGKKFTYINLYDLWQKSSSKKRKYICDVFCLDLLKIENTGIVKALFLTQPFCRCDLTEFEQVEIIRNSLKDFIPNQVAIKPHPDDKVDYTKYFPEAMIVSRNTPMQLLVLCGLKVDTVITVFSTAVSLLPQETKIVWLGGKCHPKLAKYGMNECPYHSK